MTNEEEKILEEENDTTLEEAAEEAEELQEETQDEVKEAREEIPDDIRLDPDEIRERPVLRGGLRGAADPNMIQKHIDNFLAMLCGETPVDSNVRTSAEYWLKRLATGEGGSTKKIYCHPVVVTNETPAATIFIFIFDNNPNPYDTQQKLWAKLDSISDAIDDTVRIGVTGSVYNDGELFVPSHMDVRKTSHEKILYGVYSNGTRTSITITTWNLYQVFDGVNPIN